MTENSKEKIKTSNYECPSCGASPQFDPKSQTLKCPYCNTVVEINKKTYVVEQNVDELLSNTTVWKNAEVIVCSNCGSKEIITNGELSTKCSFCGTTNIVKTSEIVGMKPHGICTFQKTIKEVEENVRDWVKKQRFVPNSFKHATIESLKGIYTPAFTFDCDTSSEYKGRLGERKTSTSRDSKGNKTTHTYTSYFYVSGTHNRKFDDLIVHASRDIPTKSLEDIEPFPTGNCSEYNEKLLTGYTSNTYSKDGKQTWEDFQQRASNVIRDEILNKYHHDSVDYLNTDISYYNSKFKYLLLPVYVGHHKHKNKNYNFYVNGCTGKVSGKAPISGIKLFFFILAIVGVIGIPLLITILNIIND